jgi:genome maintenance exonuclease 1
MGLFFMQLRNLFDVLNMFHKSSKDFPMRFQYVEGLPSLTQLTTQEKDGKRYYELPSGMLVPSVTTVLGYFKGQSLAKWRQRVGHEEASAISSRASVRGTLLHNLLEQYVSNVPIQGILTENVMPTMKQSFRMIQKVLDSRLGKVFYVEVPLYSETLCLAGRTDVVAEFDGVLSIVDFKSSLREKREEHIQDYFLQSTAYSIMCQERTGLKVPQIVVIIAADDAPEPQVFIKRAVDYHLPLSQKLNEYLLIHGRPKLD